MGKIQVHSIGDYDRGYVTLNERGNEADGIVLYRQVDSDGHVGIYYIEGPEEEVDDLVRAAYRDIIDSDKSPIPDCKEAREWYARENERIEKARRQAEQGIREKEIEAKELLEQEQQDEEKKVPVRR